MRKVLELQGLSHVYVNDSGAFLAVDQINMQIKEGEFVSLVGPSGCGKTTLLHLMSGLLKPTSGTVKLHGNPMQEPTDRLGYMLQQDYLLPWRTIRDNAAIGLEIKKQKNKNTMKRVDELLGELGLYGLGGKYPHELSGGMRQRVALARTLVTDPEILLLDEPFSALDLHIKMQLEELVQVTLDRLGKTAVLVTHDLSEACAISDRVIVLGRNPGHIRRIIHMPTDMRQSGPIEARKHPSFSYVFDQLWREFEPYQEGEEGRMSDGG